MENLKLFYSVEAEQSVLGAMLLGEPTAITSMKPKYFFREEHRDIFTAMKRLYQKNITFDIVTVSEELKLMNKLEFTGGITYLASLEDAMPNIVNAPYYIQIVYEMWQKQNLFNYLNQIDYGQDLVGIKKDLVAISNSIEYFDKVQTMGDSISQKELDKLILSKGFPTHFPTLNKCALIMKGELAVIVGDTSKGKTALAVNLIDDFLENNCKVLFFSIDMNKLQMLRRFASMYENVELWKLKPQYPEFSEHIVRTWSNPKIQKGLLLDENTIHIHSIISRIRATQPDVVIIDYIQNIISDESNPVQSLSNIMIQLQLEAQERPIIVLSQVSKGIDLSLSQRAKGSSTIIQAASLIVEMDRENTQFKYKVAKNRNWGETSNWVNLTTHYGYLFEEAESDTHFPNGS